MKINIPWWIKILAKIILSRLPFQYLFWRKLSVFKHGYMEKPEYAYEVIKQHFANVTLRHDFVALELGPGDSLFSALVCHSWGASKFYLVDVSDYAIKDTQPYQKMAEYLKEVGLQPLDIKHCSSLQEILNICSAEYLTNGLESLKRIPDNSVDIVWSQAVLEHIRHSEFLATMKELRRILKKNGVCSHEIDLRDHLENSLNNLRFSQAIWESQWMSKSGFYTNRIRYSQMLDIFKEAKFLPKVVWEKKWHKVPVSKNKMASEFSILSHQDLCISVFFVILKPL